MRRGSTPTFEIKMPTFASSFSDITVSMIQDGRLVLTVPFSSLTLKDKSILFTLSEEQTFLFNEGTNAEIQARATDNFGKILISDIKKIPIRKKYPEDT